ncbi:MAG: DUF4974 domain-containing protein [Taibaiella sp.]|nr:DUF4974 domain-containing protein [Taibaiella sp.]
MVEIHFDLFIKYLSGQASPEEAISVEDWRASDARNAAFFDELFQSWHQDGNFRIPDIKQLWRDFQSKRNLTISSKAKEKRQKWIPYSAAMIVIIVMIGYLLNHKGNRPVEYTADMDSTFFRLPDSTQLWVDQGVKLSYQKTGGERHIRINGNGSVQVVTHDSRLWVYLNDGIKIEDIGTEFQVKQDQGHAVIKVTEGKIRVYYYESSAIAHAGQMVECDKVNVAIKVAPWRGDFNFKDQDLGKIIASLSSHFKKDIQISGQLENKVMTLSGKGLTLTDCLDILVMTFKVKYEEKKDGSIYVY